MSVFPGFHAENEGVFGRVVQGAGDVDDMDQGWSMSLMDCPVQLCILAKVTPGFVA